MYSSSDPHIPSPAASGEASATAARSSWSRWLAFVFSALSFAIFVRVTLYGRSGFDEIGPKGIVVPGALLLALVAWFLAARHLLAGRAGGPRGRPEAVAAASFVPMLATLWISVGVLGSDAFAREYWIDRSLKVQLLLGLPTLVLLLQVGAGLWFHNKLTWRRAWPVLAILGFGLALRLAGTGWGLPFAYQPEETSIYFRWAMELALRGEWNPNYFQNPSLLIYLLGFEFMGVFAVARVLLFGQDPGDLYMVFRGEQELFYGLGRLNSVVLGSATIFVVYLIARRLWGEMTGLAAAALLAVNFLHVRNSQYAVNDVPSTFLLVLSLYFALRLAEGGRWRHYLLAGLTAGLAASTKYNAGMIVVSVAGAHWVHCQGLSLRRGSLARLGGAAVASLVGFVLGTPYSVLDFGSFREGFLGQLTMGQAAWSGQSLAPTSWQFLSGLVQGSGFVAAVGALLGTVFLLIRDRRAAALLLPFPLAYLAFMSAMDLFFVRWVVPEMPFVAILGAYGLEQLVRKAPGRGGQMVWATLVVLALLQPFVYSVKLDWLAHQTDTRQVANAWAERNLPRGSRVAIEAFSLLDQESLAFRATLQQLEIELVWRSTMHDLAYYRENGFDYLAVSSFIYDRAFAQPDGYADRVEFYRQLDREYPTVAIFTPRFDGRTPPFALDDLDTPFWHLFSYDRPGPTVKVYRLKG